MIVSFYQKHFADTESLATARVPSIFDTDLQQRVYSTLVNQDADSDFTAMREQLTHMNVTVPTLYKQYADICEPRGVRFIDFNIDASFGNCIDGLVMVDLQQLKPAKRKRYLGESNT